MQTLTVVKWGGAALARGVDAPGRFDGDVCVVHGAGPRITAGLADAGIVSRFVGGRRVTTAEMLPIVREAYRLENERLCEQIGAAAVGMLGDEIGLEADALPELGHAGLLRPVAPPALREALAAGRVPVVAPIARGPLNVNADDAAAALAVALRADRIVFVSDVAGVIVDGKIVDELSARDIDGLAHAFTGGILPKLQAALSAAREGVRAEVGRTVVVA